MPGPVFAVGPLQPDPDELRQAEQLPLCSPMMPHYLGPKGSTPPAVMDAHGCPPGCARRIAREGRCPSCWEELAGPYRLGCADPDARTTRPRAQVVHAGPVAIVPDPDLGLVRELLTAHGCDDEPHARRALALLRERFGESYSVPRGEVARALADTRESGESAAPTGEETPAARVSRLLREREDAGRAYRKAIYAADQALREAGQL